MFCSNCGKEIEDNTRFCAYCGEQIKENENLAALSKKKSDRSVKHRKPNIKKSSIVLAVVVVFVLFAAAVGIGFYQTSSMSYLRGFAKEIVNHQWDAAYEYFDNCKADSEEYEKWAEDAIQTVTAYQIEKLSTDKDAKEYKLVLLNKEGKEVFSDSFIIRQKSSRRLWIFPTWKMEERNLLAEDVHFVVPKDSQLLIDGKEIDSALLIPNADETMSYYAEYLFAGEYDVKITKQYYKDLEQKIQINPDSEEANEFVFELEMEPDMVWRKDYYDFLTAVRDCDFDTLNARFPETADVVKEFLDFRSYDPDYEDGTHLRFAVPYINDDAIPEIIIGIDETFGPDTYGKLFEYKDQKIQPVEFSDDDWETIYIPLNWSYIKEKQGLVLNEGVSFSVGDDLALTVYCFDGENMSVQETIICSQPQLFIQRGEEHVFGEGGYPLDNEDELKSTINGQEVDPEIAYEKINEYKSDVIDIWQTLQDITVQNLEEKLGFSYSIR